MIMSQISDWTWISLPDLLPQLCAVRTGTEESVWMPLLLSRKGQAPVVVFPLASLLHLQVLLLYFWTSLHVACLYCYSHVNIFTDSFGKNLVLQMCMSIYAYIASYCITSVFHFQPCFICKQTCSLYLVVWEILVVIKKHKCNCHIILAMSF